MHEILSEARDLIGGDDLVAAVELLEGFVSSQLGAAGGPGLRFAKFRDELLLHSSALNRVERDKRAGIDDPAELKREELRITHALLGLVDDIDRTAGRAAGPLPVKPLTAEIPVPGGGQLEKIWGRNTLQSLSWLHLGLRAGRSVCRVITPTSIGTGFLIRGGFVVTNNHVVESSEVAEETRVEFNFERDANGNMLQSTTYDVDPSSFLTEPAPLDCSVFRIAASRDLSPIEEWGALEIDTRGRIGIGEPVTIIQHPNGGEKQIALTANEVVNIYEHRLHYMTGTMRGSSGSPVFNNRWQVVAIHRAGGNLIANTSGGRMHANEGTLMSYLAKVPGIGEKLGG